MATSPTPESHRGVTPYLVVDDGAAALAFYKKAFGAVETMRLDGPGGKIGHAEMTIGGGPVMLADEHPEMGARGPRSIGGSPVSLVFYCTDVDAVVRQAVAAGATLQREVSDQFYGDRAGTVVDPFGHVWHIHTHKEEVSLETIKERMEEMVKRAGG